MNIFIKDKEVFNNFNNPLAVKIDTEQLFNSIKCQAEDTNFKEYEQSLKLRTQLNLIFSLFNSLSGSLLVFNCSLIDLLKQIADLDLPLNYELPLGIYEISSNQSTDEIQVIDLAKLNLLIKGNF